MNIDDMDWGIKQILGVSNHSETNQKQSLLSKPLTQKQYNFAVNYVKNGFDAHKAAIDAGYSYHTAKTQGISILSNTGVKQIVDKAYQKAEKKIVNTLGITFVWKMKRLKAIVEQYIPVDGTYLKGHEVKVGIQALSEMNKMQGDYAPDKRLNLTVDATSTKMKEVRKIYDAY